MRKQALAFLFCVTAPALLGIGCGPPDLVDNPIPTGPALEDYRQEVIALESEPELEN